MTRMDLPFLLGTAVTDNRRKRARDRLRASTSCSASCSPGYGAFFAVDRPELVVARRAARRAARGVHGDRAGQRAAADRPPADGDRDTAANDITLLEPPGFLMLNYGRSTFVVTLAAHVAYGAIVGADACASV